MRFWVEGLPQGLGLRVEGFTPIPIIIAFTLKLSGNVMGIREDVRGPNLKRLYIAYTNPNHTTIFPLK